MSTPIFVLILILTLFPATALTNCCRPWTLLRIARRPIRIHGAISSRVGPWLAQERNIWVGALGFRAGCAIFFFLLFCSFAAAFSSCHHFMLIPSPSRLFTTRPRTTLQWAARRTFQCCFLFPFPVSTSRALFYPIFAHLTRPCNGRRAEPSLGSARVARLGSMASALAMRRVNRVELEVTDFKEKKKVVFTASSCSKAQSNATRPTFELGDG